MRGPKSYLVMAGCCQVLQLLQCRLCQDGQATVLISAVAWSLWLLLFILVLGFSSQPWRLPLRAAWNSHPRSVV